VLAAVVTSAALDKARAAHVARMAAAGIARAVRPAHTSYDGDIVFCGATGTVEGVDPTAIGAVAAEVVSAALRRGVRAARGLGGVPGVADAVGGA
jgi:L-aminopeptidase/D-esterase-like protein